MSGFGIARGRRTIGLAVVALVASILVGAGIASAHVTYRKQWVWWEGGSLPRCIENRTELSHNKDANQHGAYVKVNIWNFTTANRAVPQCSTVTSRVSSIKSRLYKQDSTTGKYTVYCRGSEWGVGDVASESRSVKWATPPCGNGSYNEKGYTTARIGCNGGDTCIVGGFLWSGPQTLG